MFVMKPAKLTGELDLRKPRRWPLIVGLVLAVVLACSTSWWYGVGLPNQQAAQARATEQAATDAAAKKKAEESAAFWAQVEKENRARAAKADKENAERRPIQEQLREDRAEQVKTQMEAQGWTHFADDFYYQYADKSEYSCGYARCIVVHVTTMASAGCADGLYVEATVDAGGASVGRANSITASLPQGKDAIVKLTDTSGVGETMGLTDLHCLGR
jgi:hypothetical protein